MISNVIVALIGAGSIFLLIQKLVGALRSIDVAKLEQQASHINDTIQKQTQAIQDAQKTAQEKIDAYNKAKAEYDSSNHDDGTKPAS